MNSQNVYEENLKYWTKRVPGYSEVNQLELATVQKQKWKNCLQKEIEKVFSHHAAEDLHVLDQDRVFSPLFSVSWAMT